MPLTEKLSDPQEYDPNSKNENKSAMKVLWPFTKYILSIVQAA